MEPGMPFIRVTLALLMGCSRVLVGSPPPAVEPLPNRIDAVFGRAVVFPVRMTGREAVSEFEVRLDDGHALTAEVQWIRMNARTLAVCGKAQWLPAAMELEAMPAGAPGTGTGPGTWVASIQFPLTSSGQGFWIGPNRYEPNWLPDPRRLASSAGGLGRAWNSPLRAGWRESPLLVALVEPYADLPMQKWRYDLCMSGLVPGEEFDAREPGGPVDDLEALRAEVARQKAFTPVTDQLEALERARWQVALARLWLVEPSLSFPVREMLAGAVETPGGVLPLWRASQSQLNDLLDALLRPRASDEERVRHVRSWLQGFEPSVAWVVDDAGLVDALTGEFRPTIGVVNLDVAPALAFARPSQDGGPSDLSPLKTREFRTLRGEVVPGSLEGGIQAGPGVEVRVGRWSTYLSSIGMIIPVAPPGFALGPLRREWTLESWTAMDERKDAGPSADRTSAAMLTRARLPSRASRGAVGPQVQDFGQTWHLYFEARSPERNWANAGEDSVEFWFGPFGDPTGAVRVYADGRVIDLRSGRSVAEHEVEIIRLSDRWVVRFPIPGGMIESDGVLRLAVVREDPCGQRSSWPRRLLPGQVEPGRVAVQTRTWDGFGRE